MTKLHYALKQQEKYNSIPLDNSIKPFKYLIKMSYLKKIWWCKIWRWHNWTSKVLQNSPPTDLTIDGFCNYASMYCTRCGEVSNLSKQFTNKIKDKCKSLESK